MSGALTDGICMLRKELPSPFHRVAHSKRTAVYEPVLTRHWRCWQPWSWTSPPPEWWNINFCCLEATQSVVLCYSSRNGQRRVHTHPQTRPSQTCTHILTTLRHTYARTQHSSLHTHRYTCRNMQGHVQTHTLTCTHTVNLGNTLFWWQGLCFLFWHICALAFIPVASQAENF